MPSMIARRRAALFALALLALHAALASAQFCSADGACGAAGSCVSNYDCSCASGADHSAISPGPCLVSAEAVCQSTIR